MKTKIAVLIVLAIGLNLFVALAPFAHKNEGQCPFGLCIEHSAAGFQHGHE